MTELHGGAAMDAWRAVATELHGGAAMDAWRPEARAATYEDEDRRSEERRGGKECRL